MSPSKWANFKKIVSEHVWKPELQLCSK